MSKRIEVQLLEFLGIPPKNCTKADIHLEPGEVMVEAIFYVTNPDGELVQKDGVLVTENKKYKILEVEDEAEESETLIKNNARYIKYDEKPYTKIEKEEVGKSETPEIIFSKYDKVTAI